MRVDECGEILSGEGEDRLAHCRDVPRDASAERPGEPQGHVGLDLEDHDRVVAVEHAECAGLMGDLGEQFELRARRGDPVAPSRRGEEQQRVRSDPVALGCRVVGKESFAHEGRQDPVRRRRVQVDRPRHLGERQRRVGASEEPQDRDRRVRSPACRSSCPCRLRLSRSDCRMPRAVSPAVGSRRSSADTSQLLPCRPFIGEEFVRADPIAMVVGDRRDQQLVGVRSRARMASWSATRSGDPTNWVSSRSCTNA